MSRASEMQSSLSALQVQGINGSIATAVSAAGSTQGTATALAAQFNRVTTASAFQGVVLPSSSGIGDEIEVTNATTVNICVYPPSGGNFNGNTANVPLICAPKRIHTFFCVDGTSWDVDSY